ncbi:hypothetical protein ACFB49_40290 [Sphingomonas sp. DBB INV C78]
MAGGMGINCTAASPTHANKNQNGTKPAVNAGRPQKTIASTINVAEIRRTIACPSALEIDAPPASHRVPNSTTNIANGRLGRICGAWAWRFCISVAY